MIILAFPGMGKTPLSKTIGKYLDLDFGHFREAFGKSKQDESQLLKPFARLARLYEDNGFIVLSNDPKLMQVLDVDRVYLPRNVKFAARKLNTSPEQVSKWIKDWEAAANKANVPVTFLSVGLDHYLQSARGKLKKGGESR